MPRNVEDLEKLWDASARAHSHNRVLAIHFTEDGKPVDASIYQEIFDQIDRLVQFTPQDRILEVGAGSGLLLEQMAQKVHEAHGTDLSAEMLKLVPPRKNIFLQRMDSDRLQFTDSSFDKVICNAVFQCFPNAAYAERCLKEMIRVCKTGGMIYVGDIFNAYLKEPYLQQFTQPPSLIERLKRPIRKLLGKQDQNYDSLFLYPYELEDWARSAQCHDFKALLSLSRKKPVLFRMYRFDVLIVK
ncbi:MAG: class I SAM-dependent methyltransferase [Terriglobia bacterium]